MKQKSTIKRAFVYSAITVTVLLCAMMLSRSVLADGEKLSLTGISNNTVNVTIDDSSYTLNGTVDDTVEKVKWSYVSIANDQLDTSTDGTDIIPSSNAFSITVDLQSLEADRNVYIYAYSQNEGWTGSSVNFHLVEPEIVLNNSKIYYLGTTLIIDGKVENTSSAAGVFLSDDLTLTGSYAIGEEPQSAVTLTDGEYSFAVSVNEVTGFTDENKTVALYAVDSTGTILAKKETSIRNAPKLSINNPTVEVDLTQYNGSANVVFGVSGYKYGSQVGYTLTDYSGETDQQKIVDSLKETQALDAYADSLTKTFSLSSFSTEGTDVFFYLYRDYQIFDVKTVNVKRKQMEADVSQLKPVDSNNNETDTFYLKIGEHSTDAEFLLSNIASQYGRINRWYSVDNPYRLYIVEEKTGNFVCTGDGWNRLNNNTPYSYRQSISINNLNYLPQGGKKYIAYLEYCTNNNTYFRVGKSTEFWIKNEIPEMTWENSEVDDKINLPIYKDKISAKISGWRNGDVIAWTTESMSEEERIIWAKGNPKTYDINQQNNRVEFSVADFPLSDSNCYFYLIRNNEDPNEDPEVFSLGNYPVKYKDQINHFGPLRSELPLDNRIYSINNTDYYFFGELQESDAHTICGYYENGLQNDEFAWTESELTDEELEEWGNNAALNPVTLEFTGSPYSQEYYYNCYNFSIDNFTFKNDEPKTIRLYTRRNIGGGNYKFNCLGTLIVRKASYPELTSVNSSAKYYFNQDNSILKDITITMAANDVDTGIQEITITYKKDGELKTEELYKIEDLKKYAPNQSVSQNITLTGIKNDEDKYISICVKNFSGRETNYKGLFANKPELSVKPVNELESFGQKDYYISDSRNERFEITAKKNEQSSSDANDEAEINTLLIKVNGITVLDKEYKDGKSDVVKEIIDLSDDRVQDSSDNKYSIDVKATNKLNNVVENTFVFEVDANKPEITGFVVNGTEMPSNADTGKYTYIINKKVDTEIKASDNGFGGLKDIKYYWEDINGDRSEEKTEEIENHPDTASVKTSKDSSFKGFLFASADDMVGNSPENYATSGGMIIELPDKHNSDNHIEIGVPAGNAKDQKGNPLYNKATSFSVKVTDSFSGIKSVEWKVTAPNDKSANTSGSLNINEGSLSDNSWSKNGTDRNIVTSVSKQITVDGNSDDFVLYVRMVDNAGNSSEKSVAFSIDKVKPSVTVTYGNQTGDPDFKNYYAEDRTATIVVKERNFNQDSANSIIANSLGSKGTLSAWKEKRDAENPDNSTYTATVTFDKDDRYNLTYQCSDKAGNTSDAVTTPEFVIDKTVPELSITFNNGNGKNGYYANPRTATISVKEVNFDASRVFISGINGQAYTLSNWTRKENTYSTLMTFGKDGKFAFDISVKDKAGNEGKSIRESEFTIDLNKPEIIIEGVKDKSANNGTVAPKITFKDTNIDKDTISVELIGANNGRVDLTNKYTVSEDGLIYTFKNIENIKENDDLYTLRASVKDLAGNTTTEEVKFSINRFGSIYILGENLKKINDKYVQSVKGIEITEINVNKLKKGSVVITLTVNGVPKTLVEGTDYNVEAEESEGDWKQYIYKFEDNLFAKDGSYILAVVSEDEAGNTNNNSNETKEAEVKFGVDATAPIIAAVNFESNQYYDSNGMDFSVSVKDNMILDSVTVYVNGEKVACNQDEEIFTFRVEESNKRQEIKITATDLAGNEAIESYEGILIAGNILVRFLHNKLAILISSISTSVLLIGVGIFFIARKFR
ncbi:MAG: hypothetical protein J5840_02010 [Lachnospiraceae bacterium]|nr:hypothetical protein [Lachnospiraceae bacterium]